MRARVVKKRVGKCSIFVVFVRTLLSLQRGEILRFNYICTAKPQFHPRGECKRREGEKTENEILLFFNLKSRFGKEQEREYWECLNTRASAEGSQRDFFISNRRVLSLLLLYPFLFLPRVEHGTVDGVEIGEEVFVFVVVVFVVVVVEGEETQKRFSE